MSEVESLLFMVMLFCMTVCLEKDMISISVSLSTMQNMIIAPVGKLYLRVDSAT
jgi:hypothetical protein